MIALLIDKHISKLRSGFLRLSRCHVLGIVDGHLGGHHLRFLPIWCALTLGRWVSLWPAFTSIRRGILLLTRAKRVLGAATLNNIRGLHSKVDHLKLANWVRKIRVLNRRVVQKCGWVVLIKPVLLRMATELNGLLLWRTLGCTLVRAGLVVVILRIIQRSSLCELALLRDALWYLRLLLLLLLLEGLSLAKHTAIVSSCIKIETILLAELLQLLDLTLLHRRPVNLVLLVLMIWILDSPSSFLVQAGLTPSNLFGRLLEYTSARGQIVINRSTMEHLWAILLLYWCHHRSLLFDMLTVWKRSYLSRVLAQGRVRLGQIVATSASILVLTLLISSHIGVWILKHRVSIISN